MNIIETEPRARCSTKPKFYLTAREASRVLRVSIHTIRAYCERGMLTPYTNDGRTILISSRELIAKIWEYNKFYRRYRFAMRNCGWKEIAKGESYPSGYGTACAVRVWRNEWDRWYYPNDHIEPPDVEFYRRVTHIIPLEGEESAA